MSNEKIVFPDEPVKIGVFFNMNNLFDTKYNNSTFILTGTGDNTKTLTKQNMSVIERFMVNDNAVDVQVNHKFLQKQGEDDIITKLEIIEPSSFEEQGNSYGLDIAKRTYSKTGTSGGRKASEGSLRKTKMYLQDSRFKKGTH